MGASASISLLSSFKSLFFVSTQKSAISTSRELCQDVLPQIFNLSLKKLTVDKWNLIHSK